MSNTSSDDETQNAKIPKRRKIAIFLAFCGVGYQGMQKNPGAKTIEGELEQALYHSKAVPETERGKPKLYQFARSARTDKGVSAVGQVISGTFFINPRGLVNRLNAYLPDQIRVFGYKHVTTSFSSKKDCDRRRYVYLLPVFALDPLMHRDREAVLASLGSGEEYVKCFECSERGRKVPNVRSDISSNSLCALGNDVKSEALSLVEDEVARLLVDGCELNTNSSESVSFSTNVQSDISSNSLTALRNDVKSEALSLVDADIGEILVDGNTCSSKSVSFGDNVQSGISSNTLSGLRSEFCYNEELKERFNKILSCYVGLYNFHNFTTRMKADDPATYRNIISFTADTVVTLDGIEFIKCEVLGKSFMLHQIRKMMGLAVAIMRNCAHESLIQTAFSEDVNITVPMAPEVGLYLDECFFTSYNKKIGDTHEEVSLEAYREEAEAFKLKYIYSHIGSAERKYGSVALWLHSLNHRNYPDLNYGGDGYNTKVDETKHTVLASS